MRGRGACDHLHDHQSDGWHQLHRHRHCHQSAGNVTSFTGKQCGDPNRAGEYLHDETPEEVGDVHHDTTEPPRAGQRGSGGHHQTVEKAGTMIVCRARKTVAMAGKLTIICRLTAKARAARKMQSLKVRLVTTFTPTGGTAKSVTRTLVLKKTR